MPSLEMGAVFGKYRILDLIGRGGMGVVYLAEDTTLGRKVALKVLDPSLTAGRHFEDRFRQEARLVASLEHPHIVQVHAFDKINADLAIDMTYIAGGSLADREAAGSIRRHDVLRCTREVLLALASCHGAGIIHRDVKPSNILLTPDGRALLSDFGLAKLLALGQRDAMRATASSGFFVGTPRYAPPEAWEGREPTPAWDVYSVGAVLYEAVALRPPYDADSPFDLIRQMTEGPPPPLADVARGASGALSDLARDMLSRDPAGRLANGQEALSRIEALPELSSDTAAKPSTMVRILPPRSSSKATLRSRGAKRATAGAAALFLALAAVVFGLNALGKNREEAVATGLPARPGPVAEETFPYRIFDTTDPLAQVTWTEHLLMLPDHTEGRWHVLAFEGTRLWFAEASAGDDDDLSLDGHWAEYTSASGVAFRHGTLAGTGRWRGANVTDSLAAALEFRSAADGFRWRRSFLLERSSGTTTDAEFVRRFEEAGPMQRLLYGELMPRRLPWAESLERQFLAPVASLTHVPRLADDMTSIEVDGRLDEALWGTITGYDGTAMGVLPGHPEGAGTALLRYDSEGLYVGLRAPRVGGDATLFLTLLRSFDLAVERSPRWSVTMDGGILSASAHHVDGKEIPWECRWKVATSEARSHFKAEVFIPYASLGDEESVPQQGDRWRLNGLLVDANAPGGPFEVHWGCEDTSRAEHGAIIVFGPAGENQRGAE